MPLVRVDLPELNQIRDLWAVHAALYAAQGWQRHCHADGAVWHYDDGGGNWADLHHVGSGRAVLIGHDHEYSDTYFATAAEYFGEEETDLLAGAPDWWEPPARQAMAQDQWVGFIYGLADGVWQRAPYDLDDGFASVRPPVRDSTLTREWIASLVGRAPGLDGPPDEEAVNALLAAGATLTEDHLVAVLGRSGWSPADGVAAARAFLAA